MKRFLITSHKFKGGVEVLYSSDGLLQSINFAATDIIPEGIAWLKHGIPTAAEKIYGVFNAATQMVVVEKDFEVTFEIFKKAYPYLRNTHLAVAYWPRLTSGEQYEAYVAALAYGKYCERNKDWYKPMIMDKWLKTKQFKNDWKNC